MEDKQLNFSQPLLSVRRFSSAVTSQRDEKKRTDTNPCIPSLPSYKSEIVSGPITNAGTVPFVWEQIPGRPKSERSPQVHHIDRHTTVPKLPPGRTLKYKKQDSGGTLKDSGDSNGLGENTFGSQVVVPLLEKNATKVDSSKEKLVEHSSDSGDEAFVDALDTLSRGDSSFYNCSVGGLSGVDSDMKPSKTFSIDPKTRDFMMGRFLPAAKAMTSEAPSHAPRKQSMVWGQPRPAEKAVNVNKQHPLAYGPNPVQEYAHDNVVEEESDSEGDEHKNTLFKVCGLLPQFSMKGSLCLLNPVPGVSKRTRVPISPLTRRMQAISFSQAGPGNESDEPARVAIYEQRPVHGFQAAEQPKDRRVFRNEPHQIPRQRNSHKLEGSTLYKCMQGNGAELSECLVEVKEDPPKKKCPTSFKDLLADKTFSMEMESGGHVIEKTVYVDTIHKVGSETNNLISSDMSGSSSFREYDNETLKRSSDGFGGNPKVYSLVNDTESLEIPLKEATLRANVQNPFASSMLADKANQDVEIEIMNDFGKGAKYYSAKEMADDVNLDINVLPENSKPSDRNFSKLPPPPPLPKSPSDSWLCRTLPSVPSKNSSVRSYLGTRQNPSPNTRPIDPKWETFVTSVEPQHKHPHFVEGVFVPALTTIRET